MLSPSQGRDVAKVVVLADDKMGQQKVNKATPEHPKRRELIWLNRALQPACPSHRESLAATFNPKVTGSIPVRPMRRKKCLPRTPGVSVSERVHRPLVSQRRRLLAVGGDVHGRERRRMRGLRGPSPAPRLPREPRRRRPLVDAVPDVAEP